MDDLIRRQAALEKVRTMQTYKLFMGDDMILVDKAEVQTELMMLPSVQPERKKGEWIDTETSYGDGVRQTCRCSVCKKISPRPLGDFCRWCGADMRGEQQK